MRSAHAGLREDGFEAVSQQKGSEILAALLHPLAGPPAALAVVVVLFGFDRVVS